MTRTRQSEVVRPKFILAKKQAFIAITCPKCDNCFGLVDNGINEANIQYTCPYCEYNVGIALDIS